MEKNITININDYLSEEEQKEYAIEVFKETIKESMFGKKEGDKLIDEVERVIANISHNIVMEEVQKYIPNFEEMIKQKVVKLLTDSSLSYYVFREKDAWRSKDSLAIVYMNEAIRENKELLQKRIKEIIENYDFKKEIMEKLFWFCSQ